MLQIRKQWSMSSRALIQMNHLQIIQAMIDSMAWPVRAVKKLGRDQNGRKSWLVRTPEVPPKDFVRLRHGYTKFLVEITEADKSPWSDKGLRLWTSLPRTKWPLMPSI